MDRFDRVREVFENVVDLEESAREAALLKECAGDEELHREVAALLSSADDSNEFEPRAKHTLPSSMPGEMELSGTRIGNYEILRMIGSGGMSVVFEAEQGDPRRRVALKMLKLGFDTPDAQRRFRYEAEILARLRHPGIAQIYASGVHEEVVAPRSREVPWFAMEFVEGARDIIRHAAREELDIQARLRLFLRVCDAVMHGHQRGVIHRDLKPDNILVDDDGHPKVIDFGIARATASDLQHTQQTQAGQVIGTLRYMSPEQLAGDPQAIDTRSDVHALGVVLYELLTGKLPHDSENKSMVEVMRMIQEDPPIPASRRDAALNGDLDLIVSTAIAPDPQRRYASPAELAADIRRLLDREPIHARTPTLTYQLAMFTRRHRALVIAAVAVLLASIAAVVISLGYAADARASAREARSAEETADRERVAAIEARSISDKQRERAEELFASSLDFSLEFVGEFYGRLEPLEGSLVLRKDMLTEILDHLRHLEDLAEQGQEVRRILAEAYLRLGDVQGNPATGNTGDFEGASESIRHAFALATSYQAEHLEEIAALDTLARATVRMGDVFEHIEDDKERGRSHYLEYLRLQGVLEKLDPERDYEHNRSVGYSRLALSHSSAGELERALEYEDRNREILVGRLDGGHEEEEAVHALGLSYGRVSAMQHREGDIEGAIKTLEKALELQDDLYQRSPGNRSYTYVLGQTCIHLGNYHSRLKEWETSLSYLERGLALIQGLATEDPDEQKSRMMLGLAHFELGNMHLLKGQVAAPDEALDIYLHSRAKYRDALAIWQAMADEGKLSDPNRGIVQVAQKRMATAQRWIDHLDR